MGGIARLWGALEAAAARLAPAAAKLASVPRRTKLLVVMALALVVVLTMIVTSYGSCAQDKQADKGTQQSLEDLAIDEFAQQSQTTAPQQSTTTSDKVVTEKTTATTVADSFAGTYKGTWPVSKGNKHWDVPWGFTVDAGGNVQGGFDFTWDANRKTRVTFTGQVWDDGRITASGTMWAGTADIYLQSTGVPISLSGQISAGTFTGELAENIDGSFRMTATRQ